MTSENRHPTVEAWLAKADQALADAAILLANQSPAGTINRCYYAMFYAASAPAIQDGLALHKHRALISFIHREYVKTKPHFKRPRQGSSGSVRLARMPTITDGSLQPGRRLGTTQTIAAVRGRSEIAPPGE